MVYTFAYYIIFIIFPCLSLFFQSYGRKLKEHIPCNNGESNENDRNGCLDINDMFLKNISKPITQKYVKTLKFSFLFKCHTARFDSLKLRIVFNV